MPEVSLSATALYAGLNALIMLALAVQIPGRRRQYRVGLGEGSEDALRWRVRAHANNCEYVPYALILIGILELGGLPLWLVHGLGIALTVSRLAHPIGLSRSTGVSFGRVMGTAVIWGTIAIAALACLWLAAAA